MVKHNIAQSNTILSERSKAEMNALSKYETLQIICIADHIYGISYQSSLKYVSNMSKKFVIRLHENVLGVHWPS